MNKAVIFDFDGVILESTKFKTDAFRELFAEYPEHQPAIVRYHTDNVGISRYKKFRWIYEELFHKLITEAELQLLDEAFSALVLDKILHCPFVPGALETLQALQGRCSTFIASGTPDPELRRIVQNRGLLQYFTGIWGASLEKNDILEVILNKFCLNPDEVLFVGDGLSDYRAASVIGIPFIARDTPEFREQWRELGVRGINDLREIFPMIGLVESAS